MGLEDTEYDVVDRIHVT